MSDTTISGAGHGPEPSGGVSAYLSRRPVLRLLAWRLPSIVMLLLALLGVVFTSMSPRPTALYWQLLAPVFGVICVAADWKKTPAEARWRLVWTQALHWTAVLLAMRILFYPDLQRMMNSDATGLMVLAILALGTVLAGIHAAAWETAAVGVLLALAIPAAALLEQMTLLLLLVSVVILAGVGLFFWVRSRLKGDHKPQAAAPVA
jgi:hypothetical protein